MTNQRLFAVEVQVTRKMRLIVRAAWPDEAEMVARLGVTDRIVQTELISKEVDVISNVPTPVSE